MDSLPLNIRERSLAIAQLGSAVLFRQRRECGEAAVSPLGLLLNFDHRSSVSIIFLRNVHFIRGSITTGIWEEWLQLPTISLQPANLS